MTDLQASAGSVQVARLAEFGTVRRANWKFFREIRAERAKQLRDAEER